MKKLFVLFIMMFTVFGFVACNGTTTNIPTTTAPTTGGTETGINYDEQIAFPKNLTIDGKVLSWEAVAQASGYIVFADDVEVATVTTNSYDFSALEGSRIVFTVVTKAPAGMQDSAHSVSIAYVEDIVSEYAAMKLAISEAGLPLPDDFAEELVNKGMLASEFQAMYDAFMAFMEAMDEAEEPSAAYAAIDTLMDSVVNPEALISALVKFMLPMQIDSQISYYEEEVLYYQAMVDNGYYWYQGDVDYYSEQIVVMGEVKAMMEESNEDVIKTILFVINYIMSIQDMITSDLVQQIVNLAGTDGIENLNVNELVLVKDEIADILFETMPSLTDMILLVNTLYSLTDVLEAVEGVEVGELLYPEKLAGTMLLTFEAFVTFFDNFDLPFFQALKAIGVSDEHDYTKQAKLIILVITYVDKFLDENEALMNQINSVYTEAEKQAMFDMYMATLIEELGDTGMSSIATLAFFSFQKMMALEAIFADAFRDLLDAFVASEGQILLIMAEKAAWEDSFWENYYGSDWDAYDYYNNLYSFRIVDQVIYLVNSVVKERSLEEFETVRDDLIIEMVKLSLGFMLNVNLGTVEDPEQAEMIEELIAELEAFIEATSQYQYQLIKSLFGFLDEGDVFLAYANLYESTYGDNYSGIYDVDSHFLPLIFLMSNYDDYMTTANRAIFDGIIAELGVLFAKEVFADLNAEFIPDVADALLDYLSSVAGEFKAFDYATLTQAQKDRIDEIAQEIQDIIMDAMPA